MRLERGTDPDLSATRTSLLEIDCEKLRAFHEKQGTLRLHMAVEKRKEICVRRGLLDPRYASSVRDVYCSPLLVFVEGSNQNMSRPTASNDDGNTPKKPSFDPPKNTHQTMFTPPTSQEAVESESEDMFVTPKTLVTSPHFIKAFAQALHHYWCEYPHLTTDLRSEQDSREAKQPRDRSGWLASLVRRNV